MHVIKYFPTQYTNITGPKIHLIVFYLKSSASKKGYKYKRMISNLVNVFTLLLQMLIQITCQEQIEWPWHGS